MTQKNLKQVSETPSKADVIDSEYQIEVIRDYYGNVDPTYLSKKDPRYQYRFLRDEHTNLTIKTSNLLLQKGGWQLCDRIHLKRLGIKEREISPDGFLRRGGLILAFMPVELFKDKEKYKTDQANARMKDVERLLKKGDPSVGGKGMHDSMKGIQTAKDLGM